MWISVNAMMNCCSSDGVPLVSAVRPLQQLRAVSGRKSRSSHFRHRALEERGGFSWRPHRTGSRMGLVWYYHTGEFIKVVLVLCIDRHSRRICHQRVNSGPGSELALCTLMFHQRWFLTSYIISIFRHESVFSTYPSLVRFPNPQVSWGTWLTPVSP